MQRSSRSDPVRRKSTPASAESSRHVASSYGIRRAFADDSWVEVSSRPSSSSLSSANEEIITTGLRVQPGAAQRRRRRSSRLVDRALNTRENGEYEENEDSSADEAVEDSDEAQQNPASGHSSAAFASGEASSDDEQRTALGVLSPSQPFVPRPNAFSLPPQARRNQPQHASHPQHPAVSRPYRATQRHSFPGEHHTPFDALSTVHHADHDAALRASLSTLLSYANAARSAKSGQVRSQAQIQGNHIDFGTLGFVPESAVLGGAVREEVEPSETLGLQMDPATELKRGKRKPTDEIRSISKDRNKESRDRSRGHATKRASRRTAVMTTGMTNVENVSPTLLTWVVGAGMIVLVSALSFSAGYVTGQQAGAASGHTASAAGAGSAEYVSEGVTAVTNAASAGGMRRNLASKGAAAAGLGWAGSVDA